MNDGIYVDDSSFNDDRPEAVDFEEDIDNHNVSHIQQELNISITVVDITSKSTAPGRAS